MDGSTLGPEAAMWQLAHLVMLVSGFVLPLLLFMRVAEQSGTATMVVSALAYAVYLTSATVYGGIVLIIGSWACIAVAGALLALWAMRERQADVRSHPPRSEAG